MAFQPTPPLNHGPTKKIPPHHVTGTLKKRMRQNQLERKRREVGGMGTAAGVVAGGWEGAPT